MKTNVPGAGVLCTLAVALSLSLGRADTATVKPDKVNVRAQPTLSGEVITQLQKGETVVILEEFTWAKPKRGEPARWYKIELPSNTPVWVFAPYIETTNKSVNVTRLNLRAGPGENFSVVGRLDRGTPVKEIRTEKSWMEIEAPPGAYAYIAADYVERTAPTTPPAPTTPEPTPTTAPVPTPPPESTPPPTPTVVNVPTEPSPTPAVEPAPTPPVEPAPTPPPTNAAPTNVVATLPSPTTPEPTPTVEVAPKRTVTREGRVVLSMSVQAPTEYALQSPETKRFINYLHTEQMGIKLKNFAGRRVIVSGEELLDVRWTNTPIMEVESINVVP